MTNQVKTVNTNRSWQIAEDELEPILNLLKAGDISNIFVNAYNRIMVEKTNGEFQHVPNKFNSEEHLLTCIEQIAKSLNQSASRETYPILDARLPDRTRINAVMSPTAHPGSNMTIRLFPLNRFTLEELLSFNAFSEEIYEYLKLSVRCQANTLISGRSGSGKTTLLNALASLIENVRVAVVEETAEVNINVENLVSQEAPKRDGLDSNVSLDKLIVNTMRQAAETVIVGEIREPEHATAMKNALNSGSRGVMGTLHAASANRALRRYENLLLSADTRIPYECIREEVMDTINLVIQCDKTRRDGKRITEILEVTKDGAKLLWQWDYSTRSYKKYFDTTYLSQYAVIHGLDQ